MNYCIVLKCVLEIVKVKAKKHFSLYFTRIIQFPLLVASLWASL